MEYQELLKSEKFISTVADLLLEEMKGGEGSGSWDGPGQPRFAHEGSLRTSKQEVADHSEKLLRKHKVGKEDFENAWNYLLKYPNFPESDSLLLALSKNAVGKEISNGEVRRLFGGVIEGGRTQKYDSGFFNTLAKIAKESVDHFAKTKAVDSIKLYRGIPASSKMMDKKTVSYWTSNKSLAEAYAGKNGKVYSGTFDLKKDVSYCSDTNPLAKQYMSRLRSGGTKESTDEFLVVSDPKANKSIEHLGKGRNVDWLDYSARSAMHRKKGVDADLQAMFQRFNSVYSVDDESLMGEEEEGKKQPIQIITKSLTTKQKVNWEQRWKRIIVQGEKRYAPKVRASSNPCAVM